MEESRLTSQKVLIKDGIQQVVTLNGYGTSGVQVNWLGVSCVAINICKKDVDCEAREEALLLVPKNRFAEKPEINTGVTGFRFDYHADHQNGHLGFKIVVDDKCHSDETGQHYIYN